MHGKEPASDNSAQPIASCRNGDEADAIVRAALSLAKTCRRQMKEPASDSSAQPIASRAKNDEAGAIVSLPSASGSGAKKQAELRRAAGTDRMRKNGNGRSGGSMRRGRQKKRTSACPDGKLRSCADSARPSESVRRRSS